MFSVKWAFVVLAVVVVLTTLANSFLFLDVKNYSVKVDDVTLYLYTRNNSDSPDKITVGNLSDLRSSHFNPGLKNYFIIHGIYCNWHTLDPDIRPQLLEAADVNAFLVDYSGPASSFFIHDKAIVGVGKILADYISMMENAYSLTGDDFTLVGHSMGAHVSGEIGRNLDGNIGTIVAIDPADMTPPIIYVDTEKARYVQAIHTSIIGLKEQVGHLDFYPNSMYYQPGCFGEVICGHFRGVKFYGESLASGGFTAVKCDSYSDYSAGSCDGNAKSHLGGIDLDRNSTGTFYLSTNWWPPYSIY